MSSRQKRQKIAEETLQILHSAEYDMADGQHVKLGPQLSVAVAGTVLYPEKTDIASSCPSADLTSATELAIEVTNETTLGAAKRLYDSLTGVGNPSLCLLNFASAKNPGGGFQNGAEAQEESLARASGLYACLQTHSDDFYEPNRRNPKDGLYSHAILYSPKVPFFRQDDGSLCPPWYASVITSPAPNAGVALKKRGASEVSEALHERCGRILRIAKQQGQTNLVLGAFGCGVFQNEPEQVAATFDAWLRGSSEFAGAFHHVVFAIPGGNNTNLDAFQNRFRATPAAGCSSAGYAQGNHAAKVHATEVASSVESTQAQAPKGRWRKKSDQQQMSTQDWNSPKHANAGVQQRFDFFVVLDFEATCDEGSRQPQPQEIIEFPLVLVDARTLTVVDEFRSYVRPYYHPRLTAFCTNLTGIKQSQVDESPTFRDVFHEACNWLDGHGLLQQKKHSAAVVTCGDWDLRSMLPNQCQVANLNKRPKIFREWVNIKKTYQAATGKRAQGMTGMLDDLKIPLVGHHHSGLDDCRNIAQILTRLCRQSVVDLNGWSEW